MNKQKRYTTGDLYIVSLLSAKGKELERVHTMNNKCIFIFGDYKSCNDLVLEHWKGKVEVNSKAFIEALKSFKNLIFEELKKDKYTN